MSADQQRLINAAKNPSTALDYEIAQEIAATLGRLGRKLEHALATLAAFDCDTAASGPQDSDRCGSRLALVAKRARRCGISWCSARPAACATRARS